MLTKSIFTHSSLCCLLFSFYFDMFCYFSGKMIRTWWPRWKLNLKNFCPNKKYIKFLGSGGVKSRVGRVSGNNKFFRPKWPYDPFAFNKIDWLIDMLTPCNNVCKLTTMIVLPSCIWPWHSVVALVYIWCQSHESSNKMLCIERDAVHQQKVSCHDIRCRPSGASKGGQSGHAPAIRPWPPSSQTVWP